MHAPTAAAAAAISLVRFTAPKKRLIRPQALARDRDSAMMYEVDTELAKVESRACDHLFVGGGGAVRVALSCPSARHLLAMCCSVNAQIATISAGAITRAYE